MAPTAVAGVAVDRELDHQLNAKLGQGPMNWRRGIYVAPSLSTRRGVVGGKIAITFLDDGQLEIGGNPAEHTIRPWGVGI